jgi:hypothetical protein
MAGNTELLEHEKNLQRNQQAGTLNCPWEILTEQI